jgi:hypothetical protein
MEKSSKILFIEVRILDGMMGYSIISSIGGFVITLLIILLIVGIVVLILNKTGYAVPKDNERIVKMEKISKRSKRQLKK